MNSRAFSVLAICLLIAGSGLTVFPQDRVASSVWDGLYSETQAERGEAVYRQSCAACHGDTLEGQGQTPSLVGPEFTTKWNGLPVGELFEKIQTTMPADRPGQLSREQNAQILAYMLRANKFPSGSRELPAGGEVLKGVLFEEKKTGK